MICEQKNKYSKETAQKICNRIRETTGQKLGIYKCNQCGRWHLTHRTNWTKRPRKGINSLN